MTPVSRCLRSGRTIATLIAIGFASACSGTPNTPSGPVVGSPGGGDPPPGKLVDVKVTVTIPASGSGVRSDYLSPNTESLAIQLAAVNGQGVGGANPTIMNTLPKSRDCKAGAKGTVCSATTKGSPGTDVFAVTAYENVDATGTVLSVGTAQAKISGNGGSVDITNRLPLTLEGVIASVRLSIVPNKAKRGDKVTAAVTLDAYDASGAEIVGSSDYSEPIALAIQGDTNKAFLLHDGDRSGQSLTIRRPASGITLTYDGNKDASPVSVVATVSGPSGASKSVGFNLTGKQPPPPVGTIYALNFGSQSGQGATITEYSGKESGNAAPERTLTLDKTLYAVSMALDSSGNIYVGYFDSAYGQVDGKPDSGNEIAIYAPNASGSDQPTTVLQASTSTVLYPIFIQFDPSKRLVTYGATTVDENTGDAVLTYAAESSGAATPAYAFDFASPSLIYPGPTGLAIDPKNNFYLNGTLRSGFGEYYGLYVNPAANIGNPQSQPSRVIPWDDHTKLTLGDTQNVALGKTSEIYIANVLKSGSGSGKTCQAAVNVYAAGSSGGTTDKKPLRAMTLDGMSTQGTACTNGLNPLAFYFPQITLYSGSELFAADPFNNAIDEFAAVGSGNVKPQLRIAGSATHLNGPVGLVITSKVSGQAKARPVTGARVPEPSKHLPPLAKGKST